MSQCKEDITLHDMSSLLCGNVNVTFGGSLVRVVDDDDVTALAPDGGDDDGVARCDDDGGQHEHECSHGTHVHPPLPRLRQLYPALRPSCTQHTVCHKLSVCYK